MLFELIIFDRVYFSLVNFPLSLFVRFCAYIMLRLAEALVVLSTNNLPELLVLHADGREFAHVVGGANVVDVHETMWTVKIGRSHLKLLCVFVHFLQEVLGVVWVVIELVALYSRYVSVGVLSAK